MTLKRIALLLVVAACHHEALTPPPPPLRPAAEAKVAEVRVQKDCEPTDPSAELKPLTFDERSIPEGMRLADKGYVELTASTSGEVDNRSTARMLSQIALALPLANSGWLSN